MTPLVEWIDEQELKKLTPFGSTYLIWLQAIELNKMDLN